MLGLDLVHLDFRRRFVDFTDASFPYILKLCYFLLKENFCTSPTPFISQAMVLRPNFVNAKSNLDGNLHQWWNILGNISAPGERVTEVGIVRGRKTRSEVC